MLVWLVVFGIFGIGIGIGLGIWHLIRILVAMAVAVAVAMAIEGNVKWRTLLCEVPIPHKHTPSVRSLFVGTACFGLTAMSQATQRSVTQASKVKDKFQCQ